MKKFWKRWRKGSALPNRRPDPNDTIASKVASDRGLPPNGLANTEGVAAIQKPQGFTPSAQKQGHGLNLVSRRLLPAKHGIASPEHHREDTAGPQSAAQSALGAEANSLSLDIAQPSSALTPHAPIAQKPNKLGATHQLGSPTVENRPFSADDDRYADTAMGTTPFPKVTNNNTTIHEAARRGDDALVKSLLLQHTSVRNKSPDLRTPLSLAAEWGRTSTVQLLLTWGAKVFQQDGDGRRPLHWAAEQGHADVVRVLMEHGALADVRSKCGDTPTSLAWACDQREVLRLMGMVKSKKQVGRTESLATESGVIVTNHVPDQWKRIMSTPRSPPAERVRWSATQTLGTRRMTELEERWLDERDHDRFA